MKAKLGDEAEGGIGIKVVDNLGNNHWMTVTRDGEVTYHEQDGYGDQPSERTPEETEHGNQARRYAKWYIYREKGYETLPRYENPDCIVGAMLALGGTPQASIAEYFGDLGERLRSHEDGGPVELPFEDADPDDIVVYRQDIYVDPDPLDHQPPLTDQFAGYFSDPSATLKKILGADADSLDGLVDVMAGEADPAQTLPEFEIEAVSGLHYLHSDGVDEQTQWGGSPLDRSPEARIELMPVDPDAFDSLRHLLFSHLGNQVRDRYLLMGCNPPEPFRREGLGTYEGMKKQQLLEMYDRNFLAGDGDRDFRS